jgi:CRISPR-associated protein Cmr5
MNQPHSGTVSREQDAYDKIMKIKRHLNRKKADDYASYVTRLPLDMMFSGLGQALAKNLAQVREQTKELDPHYLLVKNIESWLCGDHPGAVYPGKSPLLKAIQAGDREQYRMALAETMAWLEWHKKFADAYLKDRRGESH